MAYLLSVVANPNTYMQMNDLQNTTTSPKRENNGKNAYLCISDLPQSGFSQPPHFCVLN